MFWPAEGPFGFFRTVSRKASTWTALDEGRTRAPTGVWHRRTISPPHNPVRPAKRIMGFTGSVPDGESVAGEDEDGNDGSAAG